MLKLLLNILRLVVLIELFVCWLSIPPVGLQPEILVCWHSCFSESHKFGCDPCMMIHVSCKCGLISPILEWCEYEKLQELVNTWETHAKQFCFSWNVKKTSFYRCFYQRSARGLKKNVFARSMTENHLAPCTAAAIISGILTRRGDVCGVTAFNALKSIVRCIFLSPFNTSHSGELHTLGHCTGTPWSTRLLIVDNNLFWASPGYLHHFCSLGSRPVIKEKALIFPCSNLSQAYTYKKVTHPHPQVFWLFLEPLWESLFK